MLDPRIVRTLDADTQGHWLVFINKYCSDLYSQVGEGMEENEVLNFMQAIQFASTIEGRLTTGVATEDDLEWLQQTEEEMDEEWGIKSPPKELAVSAILSDNYISHAQQNLIIDFVNTGLLIWDCDPKDFCVDLDITSEGKWRVEVFFDLKDEGKSGIAGRLTTMHKLFEALGCPYQMPEYMTISVDGMVCGELI